MTVAMMVLSLPHSDNPSGRAAAGYHHDVDIVDLDLSGFRVTSRRLDIVDRPYECTVSSMRVSR